MNPNPHETPPPLPNRNAAAVFFAVIGMLFFYGAMISWDTASLREDKLAWRDRPADLTLRYASRELAFAEASREYALPVRAYFGTWAALGGDAEANARQALEECEAFLRNTGLLAAYPEIPVAIAILAARNGDTAAFEERLQHLEQSSITQVDAIRLRSAFADPPRRVSEAFGIETAEIMREAWFHATLLARFADNRGDAEQAARWRDAATSEIADRKTAIHVMAFASLAISAAGLGVLVFRRKWLRPIDTRQPPDWSAVAAINFIAWGGLLGIMLCQIVWVLVDAIPALEILSYVMTVWFFLPVVLLFRQIHCRPRGLKLRDLFGLRPSTRLVGAGLAVLWIDGIAQMLFFGVAQSIAPLPAVIEGLGETLIWGNTTARVLDTLDAALGAGIFEELVYRGVLFMGLRRCCGFKTAALLSTLMFTLPHLQYGWVGLLSVAIFGFIMAWSVERTHSLLPAIIAHAMCNLAISIWQWTLYT